MTDMNEELADADLWSDEICGFVDAAFETVSRNPSDHETAVAYRRAILTAMLKPAATTNDTDIAAAPLDTEALIAIAHELEVWGYSRKSQIVRQAADRLAALEAEHEAGMARVEVLRSALAIIMDQSGDEEGQCEPCWQVFATARQALKGAEHGQ